MQPINNATQPWIPVSSASTANDLPGELSPEYVLALTAMANREFERYRLIGSSSSAGPSIRRVANECESVSALTGSLQQVLQVKAHRESTSAATAGSWLNADGTLNAALPVDVLFRHVIENKADLDTAKAFAELFCKDRYEKEIGDIYHLSDAYCAERSVGGVYALDHNDLMRDAKDELVDTRHEWNVDMVSSIVGEIEAVRSQSAVDVSEAFEKLETEAYSFIRGKALAVMEDIARSRAFSGSESD
jgi:hypothetical protein